MRLTILSLILLAAIVMVVVLIVTPEPCYAPPAGMDRFSFSWTQFDCQNGGCGASDLYVPQWCPNPSCESCSTPMTSVAMGLSYGSIGSGESLLWLELVTK